MLLTHTPSLQAMCESCEIISAELASLNVGSFNHSMAKFTVIDPAGDVIFVLDDLEFQVSSKILSLASPVFKAMFGPSFAEGQGQPGSKVIRRIQLSDDKAEALSAMCHVLHHQNTSADPVDIDRLEDMATLVDKYDCVRSMHYWAAYQLRMIKVHAMKEPYRLLWPSYVFGDAANFNSLTKYMVLNLPICVLNRNYVPKDAASHLPDGLIGENSIDRSQLLILTSK